MEIFASRSNAVEEREIRHTKRARNLAAECVVLLENNGVLPLDQGKAIALYGAGVRHTVRGGTGSGDVNVRSIVTVEEGFKNAGFSIVSNAWLDREDARLAQTKADYAAFVKEEAKKTGLPEIAIYFNEPYKEGQPELVQASDISQETDTAIYVISRNSGEGADRLDEAGDYYLYESEYESIAFLAKSYEKTIVILNIGGVMDLSKLKSIDGVDAIVLMVQLGNVGGDAICDVLTGKITPSGKTTDTWACNYMDYPSSAKFSYHDSLDDEYYEDGIYVGYRYFDSFEIPSVYPFGYGLSYTSFKIDVTEVIIDKTSARVHATVKNTGDIYSGKEVVQVYISAPQGDLDKPYQELVGFKKTALIAPGKEEEIDICFPLERLASYSAKTASWVIEAGDYIVRVGNSSKDTERVAVLHFAETVVTEKCQNIMKLDCDLKEIKPNVVSRCNKDDGQREALELIKVDTKAFSTKVNTYQEKRIEYKTDKEQLLTARDVLENNCTVEELVAQLSVQELAELCVGTMRAGEGSIVGNASHNVPGAAGDTSSIVKETRGVKNMILADGPAGLRLQQHFKTDLEGNVIPGGAGFGDLVSGFDDKWNESNSIDYYQYCTAIPIGWALAQSWSEESVIAAGEMIGAEMEQFGIDIWLAPALNIHRNPLCGRNFEYYSEDPLVAGTMASAMTRGVQSHNGKGTCIKHFAANNQEENRYFVNAHISERALREIYLKGFELCVKETQPFSLMTSYNLINGTHTANSHDLLQRALRDEWGFEGTVMTDWFTSQDIPQLTGKHSHIYPISASTGCIYAGNDMQMPGCQKNVDDIIDAVNTGKELDGYVITKADLQFNAANVIRVALKTM